MKTISETAHFATARKLYKLGQYAMALAELDGLKAENRSLPEVLELRWAICADQEDWANCVDIARTRTLQRPDEPDGWIWLAASVRNVEGGTLEMSYEILSLSAERIRHPSLFSALAHCACQLGRIEEMQRWERKAHRAGNLFAEAVGSRGNH